MLWYNDSSSSEVKVAYFSRSVSDGLVSRQILGNNSLFLVDNQVRCSFDWPTAIFGHQLCNSRTSGITNHSLTLFGCCDIRAVNLGCSGKSELFLSFFLSFFLFSFFLSLLRAEVLPTSRPQCWDRVTVQCASPGREGALVSVSGCVHECEEGRVSRRWTACRVFLARPL